MIEPYSQKAHETLKEKNLCLSCRPEIRGNCCHFSVWVNKEKKFKISLEDHPCKYLNLKTHWCTIYKDRLKKNPNACYTIKYAIKNKLLVKDCLYIKDNKEYQAMTDVVVYIDDVRAQLTEKERLHYELMNASHPRYIQKY